MTDDNRNLPEWERAFDEYAKNNAPDLLPGILQKINASQNITPAGGPASVQDSELTREPLQTVKGGAEKKPFYLRKNFRMLAISRRGRDRAPRADAPTLTSIHPARAA